MRNANHHPGRRGDSGPMVGLASVADGPLLDQSRKEGTMSRRRTHVGTLAIALACALAGTLLTAGPANAASRGYKITNLSSHPLKLVRVDQVPDQGGGFWDIDFEGRPPDGAVLKPGAPPHDWELKWGFGNLYAAGLVYSVVDARPFDDRYVAIIKTSTSSNDSTCEFKLGSCTAEGLTLSIYDPPGTVRDIPNGRGQEQAETLRDLCNKSNAAKCTFTPVSETKIQTQAHVVGNVVANCMEDDDDTKISAEDKVGQTNSVEISSKTEVDVFEIVKESITLKYGHEWTTEHTFTQDVAIKVRPGHMGWISATAPALRDTGDFTLTLGKTTWKLRDVYFDSPDPSRAGNFVTDDRELTPDEYKAQCPHGPPDGLQRAPAYLVPMDWKGTGRADTLLAGPESHTVRGFAGNDLLRGGRGHDALYGGRHSDILDGGPGRDTLDGGSHNDILDGGPGRDTLDGGQGADTMIDNRGPTLVEIGPDTGPGIDTVDVRDGRGDDTVICGSRSSTVTVDAGDSVIGRCGKVSRSTPRRGQTR
jgi:hypothetical protein